MATHPSGPLFPDCWRTQHVSQKIGSAHKSSQRGGGGGGRLSEAAQTLRRLVERTAPYLPKKAVRALFAHLVQLLVFNKNKLVEPVAADYFRAICFLLKYKPHLDHLDEWQWLDILEVCFALLLGDDVKGGEHFSDDDSLISGAQGSIIVRPSGVVLQDDDIVPRPTATAASSHLNISVMQCIRQLFLTPSAPYNLHGKTILIKFCRFFHAFPTEPSTHLDAITALNCALSNLTMNSSACVSKVAPTLWSTVVGMWNTRISQLKEQVVITLRHLFAFIVPRGEDESYDGMLETCIQQLCDCIVVRGRVENLNLDNLALGLHPEPALPSQVFHAQTYRLGQGFMPTDAIAWAILELGSDCMAALLQISDVIRPARVEGLNERKRRRVRQMLTNNMGPIQMSYFIFQTHSD